MQCLVFFLSRKWFSPGKDSSSSIKLNCKVASSRGTENGRKCCFWGVWLRNKLTCWRIVFFQTTHSSISRASSIFDFLSRTWIKWKQAAYSLPYRFVFFSIHFFENIYLVKMLENFAHFLARAQYLYKALITKILVLKGSL